MRGELSFSFAELSLKVKRVRKNQFITVRLICCKLFCFSVHFQGDGCYIKPFSFLFFPLSFFIVFEWVKSRFQDFKISWIICAWWRYILRWFSDEFTVSLSFFPWTHFLKWVIYIFKAGLSLINFVLREREVIFRFR